MYVFPIKRWEGDGLCKDESTVCSKHICLDSFLLKFLFSKGGSSMQIEGFDPLCVTARALGEAGVAE